MEQLNVAISQAGRHKQPLAVVIFDMDRFKSINDKYGHQAGDQALVHMADMLRKVIAPKGGIMARLGGDEFSFFLFGKPVRSVIETVQLFMRTLDEHPLALPDGQLPLRISLGVSLFPEHGQDSDTLLTNADKALYSVKRSTRNGYAIYSEPEAQSMTNVT
jgi:diguanylate cyclase (GGDEF)-like protein